jgi:hypothetical protein
MNGPDSSPMPDKQFTGPRNRREVIRFLSDEERKKAFQALIDLGETHRVTSYDDPNEWWVRTDLVNKLRELGVQFQWLTENV